MRLLPGVAALLAFALSSCGPSGPAARELDVTRTPADLVRADVAERAAGLRTLAGRGAIAFDTPEMSGTASFSTALRRPDSLLVLLEGPLGIDLGSLFLSRDRYVVVSAMDNRVITGSPRSATLRSLLPVDLESDQLFDAFAGLIPLPDGEPAEYTIEDGLFRLAFSCGGALCEYWVDPGERFVVRHRRTGADGTTLVEVTAGGITREGDAAVARRVSVRFPGQDRRVAIAYSDLTLNTEDLSFTFTIPPGARRIER